MDWNECLIRRLVKKKSLDENLIKSLIKESKKKIKTNNLLQLNEITASTKLCIVYDSLREILEAIAIKKGYKIYNHECYVSFLKEILYLGNESVDFNKFRKARNSINYYAKQIDVDDTKSLIFEILNLKKKLMGLLE